MGCSAVYFHNYIKSKMAEEMTFNNIHFDHIKPISAFNLNDMDELLDCCHYSNFQPLLANDNLCKNCKWSDSDDIFGKKKIEVKNTYHCISQNKIAHERYCMNKNITSLKKCRP